MPQLTYSHGLPPLDKFRRELVQAMAATSPVDDLLDLARHLREYEEKHHMLSDVFYRQYQAGALNDELQHCVEWAATYDLFIKTKHVVEATLMRAAIQPELRELAA